MTSETNVLLFEDDFFARKWMELLLRRDWRTRVVGEANNPADLNGILDDLQKHEKRVDIFLIDTDMAHDPNWLAEALHKLKKHSPNTGIIFTGVEPNTQVSKWLGQSNFWGYILKDEIRCSLAWAVSLAAEHHIIVTPGVCDLFDGTNPLPTGTLILDGRNPIPLTDFSDLEEKRARMAFIFSMGRRELADEEVISSDFSYGVVSALYKKMGLNKLIAGKTEPEQYFSGHPVVLAHLKKTIELIKAKNSKKAEDKETLAFHFLTLPDIEEIS